MRRIDTTDESGFTVSEIMIASAILLVALSSFFAAIASLQRVSSYETGRNRSLDDLRVTASAFAKDARHAVRIASASKSEVTMETYVNGSPKLVTYRVFGPPENRNLERLESGGAPRTFVIRLTSESIFTYNPGQVELDPPPPAVPLLQLSRPQDVRLVGIRMSSKPTRDDPAVELATEVLLRNVNSL